MLDAAGCRESRALFSMEARIHDLSDYRPPCIPEHLTAKFSVHTIMIRPDRATGFAFARKKPKKPLKFGSET
jgi:hypothetical protein